MTFLKPASLFLFVMVGLAMPGVTLGQRQPRMEPSSTQPEHDKATGDYTSVTGTIVELDSSKGTISIKNKKNGNVTALTISPKTKLKAEKNTELADKKGIKLEDFKLGETVEVTYMKATYGPPGAVTELRLKREKEKKDSADNPQKTN